MANDGTVKIGVSLDDQEFQSDLKKSGETMRKSIQQVAEESGKSVEEIKADIKALAESYQKAGMNIPLSYKKAYEEMGIDAKSMRVSVEKEAEKIPEIFEESAKESSEEVKKGSKKIPENFGEAAKEASDEVKEESEKIPEHFEKAGEESTSKFGAGLSKLGSVASAAIKGGVAIIGSVATAATGAVAGLLSLEEATEEYRVAQGKLNSAFEAAGSDANMAAYTYSEFYKILGDTDTATEASQLMAQLSTNGEDIAYWTHIAAGAYASFGDALPIEGLIEAANETVKVGLG